MIESIDSTNFDEKVLQADVPVLVEFHIAYCMPCKRLEKVIEEAAAEVGGAGRFYKVKASDDVPLASAYNVTSFPTMILFSDGREALRLVGPKPKEAIVALFD